jgi:hypothetical protein
MQEKQRRGGIFPVMVGSTNTIPLSSRESDSRGGTCLRNLVRQDFMALLDSSNQDHIYRRNN